MNDNLEKTILNIKTPELNNPETYVLTHNRFNTYMVLIFTDLKKIQVYKMPHRKSSHQEIEIVTKFDYLHLFKPNELDEKAHAKIQTNKNLLFKIEDKKYIYVGERIFSFETDDEITESFSEDGHKDVKYPFALSNENIYYMLYQKFIPVEEYQNTTEEGEYQYLYKKDSELKGDNITQENEGVVEYGNDFKEVLRSR